MKKLIINSFTALLSASLLFSCRSTEVVTPAVVEESASIAHGTRTFDFSLLIVAASKQGKTEALSGITVTAVQQGTVTSVTTNADGIAYFKDLNEGNVAYTVSAAAASGTSSGTNYAMVSGTKELNLSNSAYFNTANNTNQKGVVSQIVKMPALAANFTGKVVADFDFNRATQSTAVPGALVRINFQPQGNGNVSSGATGATGFEFLEPNFYITTADGTGAFSFTNLPALENTNMTANMVIEVITSNNGETIQFATTGTGIDITGWLRTGRTYNSGSIEIQPLINNTGSVTGLVFGDFNFLDLKSILQSSVINIPGGYSTSNLKEYYKMNIVDISSTEVTVTGGVDLINTLGLGSVTINVSTITGTTSILGVGANVGALVIGTNTFIGYVEKGTNKAFNGTLTGTAIFDILNTVAGFSDFNVKQNNKNGDITGLINTAGTVVPFSSILPTSNFLTSGVRVTFKMTSIPAGYRGAQEFVVLTDASGKYSIGGLPVNPTTGTQSYTMQAFFSKSYVRADGYTQVVNFNATTTVTIRANEITDVATVKATY
ncbi:MAG: hypothetical protein NW207_11300 [Cytophagales bacterium]|nr:hypothetical protein [Cytophagales bacterium]